MNIKKILSAKGKKKLSMVTVYSYFQAKMAEEAGIDLLLVGDSYANVMLGLKNTLPASTELLLPVVEAVRRGAQNSFIIADMPFMSYQVSESEAIRNAGLFIKAGANAIKLEGGAEIAPLVKRLTDYGIPVMGHVGLTPQYVNSIGGYFVQGRDEKSVKRLVESVNALEDAGVFAIVLELVVEEVAKVLTEEVKIPTIGIGSGKFCDGQVLVWHDLLGINTEFKPRFVKRYANLREEIVKALMEYAQEVKDGSFPSVENAFREENE
ncbi:3-methyl-2-oxobutanoate hydroxymethyltransferase [Kosmotoga pacifica]|uniref:3-methyl-2-oxobutanoate hydroxymethyltransferase n=1 Tax=Kosmotoga pacifica TaxID=1330330 RepID=A0A0G2ZAT7_9BACT|nr:3-methyl-2-oxobutanoate hydroxymethyltransferase [Kosmotoga pacifica]